MRITNALSLADTFANYHALSTMDMKLSEMNLWKTFILSLGKLLFWFSIPYLGALEEVNEAVKAVEESIRKLVSWVGSCLHFILLLYLCLYWTFLFFWIKHFSSLAYQTILKDLKFSYSRCLIGKLSENHRAWKRFAWSWKSRATWKGKWLVLQNSGVYD